MTAPLYAVCLQFHTVDRAQATELARFITDIEPRKRDDVEIVLCRRWDTEQLDAETVLHVGSKFPLSGYQAHTRWTGWPGGCNGMAKDVLADLCPLPLDGILMIEPDCVPTCADWLDRLIAEWKVAHAAGKAIMGAWRDSGPPGGHINGNMFTSPDSYIGTSAYNISEHYAWDCHVSTAVGPRKWHRTGLIKNCFQSRDATEEAMRTPDEGDAPPVLIHGFKDDSAMKIARKWLL